VLSGTVKLRTPGAGLMEISLTWVKNNYKITSVSGAHKSIKGNSVRFGDRPAAVIGDEIRNMPLFLLGMGRREE
jgi:hypothetical protein